MKRILLLMVVLLLPLSSSEAFLCEMGINCFSACCGTPAGSTDKGPVTDGKCLENFSCADPGPAPRPIRRRRPARI